MSVVSDELRTRRQSSTLRLEISEFKRGRQWITERGWRRTWVRRHRVGSKMAPNTLLLEIQEQFEIVRFIDFKAVEHQ